MKILFTLCGRAGSKGIKSKNTMMFCGHPLLYYSISAIELYVKTFLKPDEYDVVLSTDSDELKHQAIEYKRLDINIIDRKEELSGDSIAKKDVILDCLIQMEALKGYKYDVVLDLDLTSPLRTVQDVANIVDKYFENKADITYSVTSARRNPYFNQVMKTDHGYKYVCDGSYTARQQTPEVFDMNASLYAYKPSFLKSGGGFQGGYYEVIKMYDTAVLDLDKEEDFEFMQLIAQYLFDNKPEFATIVKNIS